jgi:hypothetical protein
MLGDDSGGRILDDRLQRTVHLFETAACTFEQPVRDDGNEDASELLALPEECLGSANRLKTEHVLAVKQPWQTEVSEPPQFTIR